MSTNINSNILKNWIIKNIGVKMSSQEARELGLEKEYKDLASEVDNNSIELDDILNDVNMYEQFAVLYTNEKEQSATVKDKEREKEEQLAVKDKNKAGV
jgi:hypothetical protein